MHCICSPRDHVTLHATRLHRHSQVTPLNAGVYASADGAEVATSVSLVEWFLNFYEATQEGALRPVEGIVRAGEVLFVPRGWWHLAMNLEVGQASS